VGRGKSIQEFMYSCDSQLILLQINAGIQAADSAIVNNDAKTTFKNANEWLNQKLQQANSGNNNGKA
jgi:hypothetical protein